MPRYFIGELEVNVTEQPNERRNERKVLIGGDRGDVHATGWKPNPTQGEDGRYSVILIDAEMTTNLYLNDEEVKEEAENIAAEAIESIGVEALY